MPYISNTDEQRKSMLAAIGIESFEELLDSIPAETRIDSLNLPDGLSEMETLAEMGKLAAKNTTFRAGRIFAGGGIYNHYIPPVVSQLASRSEFVTAYTPYQSEVSQGLLQTIFEYQTYICELTGLEVSNASSYGGASACADAVSIARTATKRKKAVISPNIHPHYRETFDTYNLGWEMDVLDLPYRADAGFVLDAVEIEKMLAGDDVACVVVQIPNFYGCFEGGLSALAEICHSHGTLLAIGVYPFCAGWVKRPGDLGADIAFGEGQSLGIPMGFGGPGLGFLATKKKLVRFLPGRLIGKTTDENGRNAYVMTLQAREQHIRRGKANSSICTNSALMALTATIYLSSIGKEGFKEVGALSSGGAHYLAESLCKLDHVSLAFPDAQFFNEFVIKIENDDPDRIFDGMIEKGVLPGIPLSMFGGSKDRWLVAVTEQNTEEDLEFYVNALKSEVAK